MGIAVPRYTPIYNIEDFEMLLEDLDSVEYWELYDQIKAVAEGAGKELTSEQIEVIMKERLKNK
jgi:hypothetical protein